MQIILAQLLILITLLSCGSDDDNFTSGIVPQSEESALEVILDRDDVIWGFETMPDNRIIFTERSGKILITDQQGINVVEAGTVPGVSASGEAGLLDLRLHPQFATNNQIYYCYSAASGAGRTQALGRATLNGNTLSNFEKIFDAGGPSTSTSHFGCRIEILNDNQILLSVGDQNQSSSAQDPNSFKGKIVSMDLDGNNPEIWSSGHRNPQGLTINPETKEVFSSEHGPTGDDELNIIVQGQNYGWPGESGPGFTEPILTWNPAIAPSGIAFYTGNKIEAWRGNLFIATLRGQHIRRLVISGSQVVSEEILFANEGLRFRNLRTSSDGYLYFSTDDGKLGRIISQ